MIDFVRSNATEGGRLTTPAVSRVLLPTRFDALSYRAAEYMKLLVPECDIELHLVHVVPPTQLVVDANWASARRALLGPSASTLLEQARHKLSVFVNDAIPEYAARTTAFTVLGGVSGELIKYAHNHSIDLVIMGTHAEGAFRRLVFGSITKGVVKGVACPVLLVPARDAPR